jgi:hypothetical protein
MGPFAECIAVVECRAMAKCKENLALIKLSKKRAYNVET